MGKRPASKHLSLRSAKQQTTDTVIMVSPDNFQYNVQTAVTNSFQQLPEYHDHVKDIVSHEFNNMVRVLRKHKIRVLVMPSRKDVITPDAVFPNNWFSLHRLANNKRILILYSMLTESRRLERQVTELKNALKKIGISIHATLDLSNFEKENKALEGTGALVLDRVNKLVFTSLSLRANLTVLKKFTHSLRYKPIVFHSYDKGGVPIYHTNVMLSIGSQFAVICAQSIHRMQERIKVLTALKKTGRQILEISQKQMEKMAANILELKSTDGKTKIVMSKTAYNAFSFLQRKHLRKFGDLVVVNINHIEKIGGGSARCMLAEIF